MYYYGPGLIFFVIATLITTGASGYIRLKYSQTKSIPSSRRLKGVEVARKILDANDLKNVKIEQVSGELTDHYDPKTKTVRLSPAIYDGSSLASVSVASHECGHAIQDKNNYVFLHIRRKMVPTVNLISHAGYIAIVIGLAATKLSFLLVIGIVSELVIFLFQVITLPVEFNASARALKQIEDLGIVSQDEKRKCKGMLTAAALTYVAAVAAALMQVFRLVLFFMINNRDDD